METLTYAEARDRIEDGDIIFPRNSHNVGGKICQWFTNSPYFHVAIAFWIKDPRYNTKLCIVEEHMGGQRIVSLSAYSIYEMDIVKSPVPFSSYGEGLLDRTGYINYSYMDLIAIGLKEKFNYSWKNFSGEVCSEMVARVLREQGIELPDLISPAKLFNDLTTKGFEHKFRTHIDTSVRPRGFVLR